MASFIDASPTRTAATDFPELIVEWLPTVGPNAADGEWCDITEYAQAVTTSTGRQYELDQFTAGRATVTLVATSRLFDSEWTSGPFYPYLIPMKQLRVSAIWLGVRYPVWRGYIMRWGRVVQQDKAFFVTVECSDAFQWLEQIKLPTSAWALEVQASVPSMWLRLGESNTEQVTDSAAGGNYGFYQNVQQGVAGLVPNDSDGAIAISDDDSSANQRVIVNNPNLISGYPFTVTGMFQAGDVDPDVTQDRAIFYARSSGGSATLYIALAWPGGPLAGRLYASISNSVTRWVTSSNIVTDNLVHHFAVVFSSSSSFSLYVDGIDVTTVTTNNNPAWITAIENGYYIGNIHESFRLYGFRGTIDEIAVWDAIALDASTIAMHALAGRTGWDGDDTGARVSRFLDSIDWPTTLRSISTGISTLGPANWSLGASALSVLQAWADTEYGQFFIGPDGALVWRSRHYRYLNTRSLTSQATFGDATSGEPLQFPASGYQDLRDEQLIRNPVRASREGGVSVEVKDQNLIDAKYGNRSWSSPTTQDRVDSTVRDRALWLLGRYKELGTRVPKLTINPRRPMTGDAWAKILGLGIGDRITVKRTPLAQGSQIVMDQWIESVSHSIVANTRTWETTYVGSPVEAQSFLIFDDAVLGLLDTGTLAY